VRLGTLLAERLLYSPSVGYCMMISLGVYNVAQGFCMLYSWLYSYGVSESGKGRTDEDVKQTGGKDENSDKGQGNREGKGEVLDGIDTEGVQVEEKHSSDEGEGGLDVDQSFRSDSEVTEGSLPVRVVRNSKNRVSATDSAGARCSICVTKSEGSDRNSDKDGDGCRNRNTAVHAKCVYWILITLITATYSYMTVRIFDSPHNSEIRNRILLDGGESMLF
jgi:hypothetical protein